MSTINLQSVELVSVIHTAPANGAPSSQDYYDGEVEKVTDLATLATFVNNTLLPMLNALPAAAAVGLLGTAIYSDTVNQDALVYDSLTNTPLAITDSLRVLFGMIQTTNTTMTNLSQQVAALQARLSASNQNDVSIALQGITSSLANQASQIQGLDNSFSAVQLLVGTEQYKSVTTGAVTASSSTTVTVSWATAFADNSYAVGYSLEDASGYLEIQSFTYESSGVGIIVTVKNTDSGAPHTGTIHATGTSNTATA